MRSPEVVARARRYYDANTGRFLRFGQGGYAGAIHRSVWAPGVADERAAFEYADRFVLERLRAFPRDRELHVLDLGCGVGASLAYLAERAPIRGTGVTISPVQAKLALQRLAAARLDHRVRVLEGSYLDLPPEVGVADLAFSIEAFSHCPDPERYFQQAAEHLAPGGLLLILDDFLAASARSDRSRRSLRILDDFREGWAGAALHTPGELAPMAARHGFDALEDLDLTPYLECGRPRDRAIAALASVMRHLPLRGEYVKSLLGGTALQAGLRDKLIEYRYLVLRRRPA